VIDLQNRMKHLLSTILLFSFILLAACSRTEVTGSVQDRPTLAPTVSPTTTTTTEDIHVGITVIPPATRTSTPVRPTRTPMPTWTPLPTNTPEPTGTATPPGMAKLKPKFNKVFRSPDGRWLWTYESADPERDPQTGIAFSVTHIVSVDGDKEWKVQLEPGFSRKPEDLIASDVWYSPFFWMPNDPYVYLVGNNCCYDSSFGDFFFNGWNMVRLNLNTGEVTTQVPGWKLRNFTFSENGLYLLDGNYYDGGLKITRIRDGRLFKIPLPANYTQSGMASFSPDNNFLAIQSCVESELDPCILALLIVDIKAENYRVVISDLAKDMGLKKFIRSKISWVSDSQVHITEEKTYDDGNITRQWLVDIVTGKVSELK
jgi:hypothetical protein